MFHDQNYRSNALNAKWEILAVLLEPEFWPTNFEKGKKGKESQMDIF
jgi:hypothetical protein